MMTPRQFARAIKVRDSLDAKNALLWCWNIGVKRLGWAYEDLSRALKMSRQGAYLQINTDALPSRTLIPQIYDLYADLQRLYPIRQVRANAVSTKPVAGRVAVANPVIILQQPKPKKSANAAHKSAKRRSKV